MRFKKKKIAREKFHRNTEKNLKKKKIHHVRLSRLTYITVHYTGVYFVLHDRFQKQIYTNIMVIQILLLLLLLLCSLGRLP